jgi:type III pantothenate kinase
MLLAVDIGNSNIVVGLFDGQRLVRSWRLASEATRMADEYAALLEVWLGQAGKQLGDLQAVAISSVVPPLTATFQDLCQRYFRLSPLVVTVDLDCGIKIAIDNPREMGADRIVNALAASRMHRVPAIIIDFGTATTFDAVSAKGELLGSAIAPGFLTAMEGLYQRAARLFSVELTAPPTAIGRGTVAALQSGAVYGYAGLVEGLVARIRREMEGDPLVIATGGLAPAVVAATEIVDVTDPDLTMHGLRLIYELNAPRAGTRGPGDATRRPASGGETRGRSDGQVHGEGETPSAGRVRRVPASPRPRVIGRRRRVSGGGA